jgi:hypothetical protein
MSAYEKCWRDSRLSDNYEEVLQSRKDRQCTAEEQAGESANPCPLCGRWTLHQYTGQPMCGCPTLK